MSSAVLFPLSAPRSEAKYDGGEVGEILLRFYRSGALTFIEQRASGQTKHKRENRTALKQRGSNANLKKDSGATYLCVVS